MKQFKKILSLVLLVVMVIALITGCNSSSSSSKKSDGTQVQSTAQKDTVATNAGLSVDERVKALLDQMTIEEKAGQMVQASIDTTNPGDVSTYFLGSIFSGADLHPGNNTRQDWIGMCTDYQNAAKSTRLGIPIIYGIDAIHGHNTVYGATVFPHNIGLGAADDPELMSEIASVTAQEMIATGVNWNFSPCIAVGRDERWGRTYESFSEDPDLVSRLIGPYVTTFEDKYNIATSTKHYVADGGTSWTDTPDKNKHHIDQGDAIMSEEELRKIHLPGYKKAIEAGTKAIMVSFSSWNGVKNSENKYLIQDVLKGELGFKGFVVSDYEAIHQVKAKDLYQQVVTCLNAGIDMFMEPNHWKELVTIIPEAVKKGDVTQSRIDDAVSRILKVKFEMGLFENPLGDQKLAADTFRSDKSRAVAEKAVRESLVLLKNQNNILPLKKNAKIFLSGPAMDNIGIQCSGWTKTWEGGIDKKDSRWMEGTTILDGFKEIAEGNGGEIITDPKNAKNADVAVVVLGEKPYVEYIGDDGILGIYDGMALAGNKAAIEKAKATGLPVVVILVSGRPRIISGEIDSWNAFVEAWLPGTEGAAVADVLYGDYDFRGKLPVTWPKSLDQIPINFDNLGNKQPLFPYGFGLKMKN